MSGFGINIDETNGVPLVQVHGEVDLHTCPQLHQSLSRLLTEAITVCIIDLNHVAYIDSTGLGVIALAAKNLQEKNGKLHIVCTQPQILKVLELSGLAKKNIIIYPATTEALAALT